MPTLTRRQDGCYIVRSCHDDEFSTWQVMAAGVLYLQRRGVKEGGAFSSELFRQLKANNWVYTGDHLLRPSSPLQAEQDIPSRLRPAIERFHVALRNGDALEAKALMWQPQSNEDEAESADLEINAEPLRIESWMLRDVNLLRFSSDTLEGVENIATVTVGLRLRGSATTVDVKNYWLKTADGWRVLWKGIPAPATQ